MRHLMKVVKTVCQRYLNKTYHSHCHDGQALIYGGQMCGIVH